MKLNISRLWPVLILITVFLLPAYALAQTEPDSSRKALRGQAKSDSSRAFLKMNSTRFAIDSLKIRLALTPEQETKIGEILKIYREQAVADRELYKGFPQAQIRATKERFDKADKEIFALLDEKQKKKYEVLKKERFTRMKETQKQKATPKAKPANTP